MRVFPKPDQEMNSSADFEIFSRRHRQIQQCRTLPEL